MMTPIQAKLLKAIAVDDGIDKPTSASFIREHNLGSPSTINSALRVLESKELIYKEKGAYHLYDIYMKRYLKAI